MKCPNCESEISADARFCGECGQALKQLGKSLVEEAKAAAPDLSGLHTIDDMDTRQPKRQTSKLMQPGEVFAGRFEIQQVVGEGGMGVVYRAHDKVTERDVALKLIRADRLAGKDAVKRLIREGVTSRDIRHKNVLSVYDVGIEGEQPFMSMEYLPGQSLRAWNRKRLQTSADVSMKTAANIVAEILAGLEAAHASGVVHRDLKPENVMLLTEPNDQGVMLKILDFGVARAAGAGDTGATSLGTPNYMAPEQITAPDAAQPSADLYSLSVMFYELLVGVLPQGHWQPPSGGRSDVPPAVDKLIERGLSNNTKVRPQNVAEYARVLADAMKAGGNLSSAFAPWLDKLDQAGFKPLADSIKHNLNTGVSTGQQSGSQATVPATGKSWSQQWKWITAAFSKNYANGKGRAPRMEYWCVIVLCLVFLAVGFNVDGELVKAGLEANGLDISGVSDEQIGELMGQAMAAGEYTPIVTSLVALLVAAPMVSVTSRRLHDMDKSGMLGLIAIIPMLGQALALLWGWSRGTVGPNKHGPDPLQA